MNLFTPTDRRPVHFVGIGGAGMSALALIACRRGVVVSGCDTDPVGRGRSSPPWARGSGRGTIRRTSTARAPWSSPPRCRPDHPELERARALGLPVVPRKEALAALIGERALGGGVGHARQDHHDGDDHRGAHGGGARAHRHRRRTGERLGRQRAGGRRRSVRGRGRRVRQGVPDAVSDRRDREQRRARPPRVLRLDGGAGGRLRRVRRPGRDRRRERRRSRARGSSPAGSDGGLRRFGFADDADVRITDVAQHADRTEATVRWRGGRVAPAPAPGAGRAQPAERRRRAGRHRRHRRRRRAGPPRRWRSSAAWAAGSSGWASTAASRWWTTTRTIRRSSSATLAAARQAYPGRRLVAVFQPHLYSRTAAHGAGDGRGAGGGRPGGRHRGLRRARAADRRA